MMSLSLCSIISITSTSPAENFSGRLSRKGFL
jgi:hypothetical protein